ncbi:MAG: DDE-type integrase/transposase/recombinase [Acidobacteriia bacterium]|nr:DDE-type integrase/transposase/recombinase [Terriglobia bacterium]
MNRLSSDQRAAVISCLIEGNSIRSTVRITGVAKKTVIRLVVEVGAFCADYQDRVFRNLKCQRLQVDECWSYCYCKAKNVTPEIAADNPGAGDAWLWAAIDADTKLVPCWLIAKRDPNSARDFIEDLAGRLSNRVQLTSDGLKMYVKAVDKAFGEDIDYAMLVKVYGTDPEGEKRYSPAVCLSCEKHTVTGNPDPLHINTSYIERHNLSVRMTVRRFTRLTNAFSKKIENHIAAVSLGYFAYNFIKLHRTLRTSPAMAAGVTDRLWDVTDLVAAWEAEERTEKAA